MRKTLEGFRDFLMRGNIVDLAVAVVLGVAFNDLVKQFTASFLQPLINLVLGGGVRGGKVVVNGQTFDVGGFVNQVVTFVIIAATLYFLVVVPLHRLLALRRTEPPVDTPTRECPECLSSIPVAARRCAFCTAEVAGAR